MYTYLHHTTRWAVCLAFVVFCMLLSLFCFFIHWSAIPRSAHRTSETILCLRVTAPTRCVRQNRWFQTFFIFTPTWGRFPFWLMFFRWVGSTTNQFFLWDMSVFPCVSFTHSLLAAGNICAAVSGYEKWPLNLRHLCHMYCSLGATGVSGIFCQKIVGDGKVVWVLGKVWIFSTSYCRWWRIKWHVDICENIISIWYMIYMIFLELVCYQVCPLYFDADFCRSQKRTGPMVQSVQKQTEPDHFASMFPGWESHPEVSLRIGRIIHKYIYIHICLCNKYVTIYSMCIYIYIRCTEWFWPTPGEFIESAFFGPWTSIENSRSHSPIQRGIMVISRTNLTFPKTKIAPSQKEVKDPLPLPPLVWRV